MRARENIYVCTKCARMRPESRLNHPRSGWACKNERSCKRAEVKLIEILAADKEYGWGKGKS